MPSNTNPTFHPSALAAVNQALVMLGQDVVITELSTTSSDAHTRKAAYVYESSRMRVLRDHAWRFASMEMRTAGIGSCDPADALRCRYPIPPKMVALRGCFDHAGLSLQCRLTATQICTDRPVARIVYTADIADLDKWTPEAYGVLVQRLAADLAKPITGRINERQMQEQAYAEVLANAKLHDAREANVEYDAYGSNHYADVMCGGRTCRDDGLFRR